MTHNPKTAIERYAQPLEKTAFTFCTTYSGWFTATGVAVNRGADFVKHLVPSRRARQNKALDPTALAGW
jgi:hypothetical protein